MLERLTSGQSSSEYFSKTQYMCLDYQIPTTYKIHHTHLSITQYS